MPKLAKASDGKLEGLTFPRLAASCPGISICPVKSGQVPQDRGNMKKCKKAASILLSVIIILGLMPMSGFAENNEGDLTNANQIGSYYEVNDVTGELPGEATLAAGGTQQSYADGQVLVNKTISHTDKENLFNINLEVTTKNKIEQRALSPDAAVVLVIDVSRSMDGDRLKNAKTAAQTFINSFASDDETVKRKVAIVTFSGKASYGWYGTYHPGMNGATTVQPWTDASELKGNSSVIDGLIADGGTNIAAGLQLAKNLLANTQELGEITNKSVILLTDGKPTFGMDDQADRTSDNVICPNGDHIIGTGNSTTHKVHSQVESIARSYDSDINRYAVFMGNDTIKCTSNEKPCGLTGDNGKPVSDWLRNDCGFTTMSTTDAGKLTQLFESIIEMIEIQAQAWIFTDPMSEYIDVVNPELADYNSETREIVWDLKNAPWDMNVDKEGNTTYTYSRSYQVRLNNLKPGFVADQEYPTNGVTSLTYTISQGGETEIPELRTAYFNIPSVKGFAGDLAFTKVDDFDQSLAGAGFTLKAEDGDFSMTASSDTEGIVSFANIPSGHTYKLEETTVPTGYQEADGEEADGKTIGVAFGAVSGLSAGARIVNRSEKTSVTVNKIWEDNNNQAGERPASIQVQLYANGVAYGAPVTISAPQTQAGNAERTVQTVEEEQKSESAQNPEAAIPEQTDEDQAAADQAETVEAQETDVTPATPADSDNVQEPEVTDDQTEPADTEMQALSEEASEEVSEEVVEAEQAPSIDPVQTTQTAVVNTWIHTWNDLPKYNNGEKIVYTVKEITVPDGYAVSYGAATDSDTVLTIINTMQPTRTYTVKKVWQDDNNRDGIRPPEIEVELFAKGSSYGKATLNDGNDWSYTWSGLPTFDEDGTTPIQYTVNEPTLPTGYESTVSDNIITNTHTPETINIPVTKVWDDNNDAAGKRPETVMVNIKNGDNTVATLTLSGEGDHPWTATAVGLPWYKDGQAINYTVVERAVPYYTCNITENGTKGFTITNTYSPEPTPETVAVPVSKVWDDNNNAAGKRPESIAVNVMNGDTVAMTVTLNESNSWEATVTLPKTNSDGQEIKYTVMEVPVVNYEPAIAGNMNGFTITNTYKAPDIPVYPPYTPPYIPPVVPTPDPVNPQPLPPDDPLIEDPDKPIVEPQPLPPDDPLEDPSKDLPDDEYLQEANADKNPKQPKTGDEAPLLPLCGLLLVSAGALGAIYIKRKKD